MNPSPPLQPCVVVHGVQHARSVLELGRPATLLSAPGAALFAGAAWWRAVVDRARAGGAAPDTRDVLDCADAPGLALEAVGLGQRWLVLEGSCPAFGMVARLGATRGVVVLPARPAALDLRDPGALRQLPSWLVRGRPAS